MAAKRELVMSEWSKTFEQEADGNDAGEQYLKVKQEDCGGGPFYVIETERWAFDDIDELIRLLTEAGVPQKSE